MVRSSIVPPQEIILWESVDGKSLWGRGAVPRGTKVVLILSGYRPGSRVVLELHSKVRYLAVREADAAGIVRAKVRLPSDAELGLHHVHAIGTGRDAERRVAMLPVTIVEDRSSILGAAALCGFLGLLLGALFLVARRRRAHDLLGD